jgi:phosphotriesterase-related protein
MERHNRREFLEGVAAGLAGFPVGILQAQPKSGQRKVLTVQGPISPEELGITLMHEHVMVDFIGADQIRKDRYDPKEVFETVLPYLKQVAKLGCRTLVECTPAYIGRDAALLLQLSRASGLHLLTNTGYYAAADHKYVPRHAYEESADQLARRWIDESKGGIEGTRIKPGLIKIGVSKAPLAAIDRKIVQAAAKTHKATGLTIASHTGGGIAAMEQLDILQSEQVSASAFVWVHAHSEPDRDRHKQAAERGAWVEFDGINRNNLERDVKSVQNMLNAGHLERILLSMDAGWYHVGEPRGGKFRDYEDLLAQFVPALKQAGLTGTQIRTLLIDNPARCLSPVIRLSK